MKRIGYLLVWIGLIGLFNLVCFVVPDFGIENNPSGFWIYYGFVMLSFFLHLVFQLLLNSEHNENNKKSNIPLSVIGYVGLILMVLTGMVCVKVSIIPNWVGIVLCYVILLFTVTLLFSVKRVSDNVSEANQKLNANTSSFRGIIDNAHELLSKSKKTAAENEIKKAYEAIRYSEPISYPETLEYETEISNILKQIDADLDNPSDSEKISNSVAKLLSLLEKRTNVCKAVKRM